MLYIIIYLAKMETAGQTNLCSNVIVCYDDRYDYLEIKILCSSVLQFVL